MVGHTMGVVETADSGAGRIAPDEASQHWLDGLRAKGPRHDQCVRELHALLLRTARHEVQRISIENSWMRGATETDWFFCYDAWAAPLSRPS